MKFYSDIHWEILETINSANRRLNILPLELPSSKISTILRAIKPTHACTRARIFRSSCRNTFHIVRRNRHEFISSDDRISTSESGKERSKLGQVLHGGGVLYSLIIIIKTPISINTGLPWQFTMAKLLGPGSILFVQYLP